jgi:hypothetical protein
MNNAELELVLDDLERRVTALERQLSIDLTTGLISPIVRAVQSGDPTARWRLVAL